MAQHDEQDLRGGVLSGNGSPTLWGALIGIITFAFVAVPISTAVGLATHPATRELFSGRLEEATAFGYSLFWWVVAALLVSIPVLVGWGVAKLSGRTLAIIAGIVVLFFVALLVLAQIFLF